MSLGLYTPGCPCCDAVQCQEAGRTYFIDPPDDDYEARAYTTGAVFLHAQTELPINAVTVEGAGSGAFHGNGDITAALIVGAQMRVSESTGNDGIYTIRAGSVFSGGNTTVNVDEAVPDATVDGTINLTVGLVINAVTTGVAGSGAFRVPGDVTGDLVIGDNVRVSHSTGNDGTYTIRSGSAFSGGNTTVNVAQEVVDATVDGSLHLEDDALLTLAAAHSGALTSSKRIVPQDKDPGFIGVGFSEWADTAINAVTTGAAGSGAVRVAGDITATLVVGRKVCVFDSTANDAAYTIRVGSAFAAGNTTINVAEAVADPTVDGQLNLSGCEYVYILAAGVQRVAGSTQGVALFGRYALMFHNDELKWKVHRCSGDGTLGSALAELTVQDYDRSTATLYLIRHADDTVRFRLMATYCTAPPMEFVDDDPGAWPVNARTGLLGLNGGAWEYWRVSCGLHKNRYQDGQFSFSPPGYIGVKDRDLFHAAAHSDNRFVAETSSNSIESYQSESGYEAGETETESGSLYTEIHDVDLPGSIDTGQILFNGSVGPAAGGDPPIPTARYGVFLEGNLLLLDPTAKMLYWSACDDVGVPTGSPSEVRDRRVDLDDYNSDSITFTIRRVRNPAASGYNLLFYVSGDLVYTTTVSGEKSIYRIGCWWENSTGSIFFGGTTAWDYRDEFVVPCSDCPEELRRNPPIGWSATINVSGAALPCGDCDDVQASTTIINHGCVWAQMPYFGGTAHPGAGSPPLVSTQGILLYSHDHGVGCADSTVHNVYLSISCGPCGASLEISLLLGVVAQYEPIPSGYAGGALTLNEDVGCSGSGSVRTIVGDCVVPASLTLSPIYTPLPWLHTT